MEKAKLYRVSEKAARLALSLYDIVERFYNGY